VPRQISDHAARYAARKGAPDIIIPPALRSIIARRSARPDAARHGGHARARLRAPTRGRRHRRARGARSFTSRTSSPARCSAPRSPADHVLALLPVKDRPIGGVSPLRGPAGGPAQVALAGRGERCTPGC